MHRSPSIAGHPIWRYAPQVAFVALYVLLDWASFIQPLHGLNITPWNPPPALGIVFWLAYGRRAAIAWFSALLLADLAVRGLPAGWVLTVALSAWLVIGYGAIGEILRRHFTIAKIFGRRRDLLLWLSIITLGTFANACVYVSLLRGAALIEQAEWTLAIIRYWIGDLVGVTISMPIFWMLATKTGRKRLRIVSASWETAAYTFVTVALVWLMFGFFRTSDFNHFYFLFLPIVWAAARHGLAGASVVAFILQIVIVGAVIATPRTIVPVFELQLLLSALTLACFFIGVVVDEQKQIAAELKQTMKLAAAGEMAAALAHELNQPLTALLAYGRACDLLLAHNDTGDMLRSTIAKVIAETNRTAGVVQRLRDFFRTGAMRLESVDLRDIVKTVTVQFEERLQRLGITLTIDPIPEVLVTVDRLQIELVLRNLLDNAFDAVALQDQVRRQVQLSASLLDGKRLAITISDNGPGILDNMKDSLFETFASSKSSGMGLGLVLSRTIIEAHGGKLWSEESKHGVFKFVLPLMDITKNEIQ